MAIIDHEMVKKMSNEPPSVIRKMMKIQSKGNSSNTLYINIPVDIKKTMNLNLKQSVELEWRRDNPNVIKITSKTEDGLPFAFSVSKDLAKKIVNKK